MRISLNVTDFGRGDAETLATIARTAEAAGLDTLWVPDHVLQVDPTAQLSDPMLEACTTLGFLAAVTRRIRLGTMVTAASLRPAAVAVKAVTTLDVLSGGRAWLGVGAGYESAETGGAGLPLAPVGERFDRLADVVGLALHMWRGDTEPFHGATVDAAAPLCAPAPLTRPHPPILIGGMGERRTLALVARHGDACNLFDIPDGGRTLRRKLAVLDGHCERAGRPPGAVLRTVSARLADDEDAGAFAQRCRAFGELGLEHVVVVRSGPWTPDRVRLLGEVQRLLG